MSVNFTNIMLGSMVYALSRFFSLFEDMKEELLAVSERMREAYYYIMVLLIFGHTRKELIKAVKEAGYSESYAEKFVDKVIAKLNELRLIEKDFLPPKKGIFGKPWSRETRAGRPPTIYRFKLVRLPSTDISVADEKVIKKAAIIAILLGEPVLRYFSLFFEFMHKDRALRRALAKFLAHLIYKDDRKRRKELACELIEIFDKTNWGNLVKELEKVINEVRHEFLKTLNLMEQHG